MALQDAPPAEPNAVWRAFKQQQERCRMLFNKLSELPEWNAQPCLDMYNEALQEHGKLRQTTERDRGILERSGMTRWQLGEISSRIGQIYSEYYKRTSDTRFLKDAYAWYNSIRSRQYFKPQEPSEFEMLQHLRYYMRFTLVCMLLQQTTMAAQLLTEMQAVLNGLSSASAKRDWSKVLDDTWRCVQADTLLPRQSPTSPATCCVDLRLPLPPPNLPFKDVFCDAIVVSYRPHQPQVGILPMDFIRLSQALEWRPSGPISDASAVAPSVAAPKKILLFRCRMSHLQSAIATTLDGLPTSKGIIMYISADRGPSSAEPPPPMPLPRTLSHGERAAALSAGGVVLYPCPKSGHMPAERRATVTPPASAEPPVRDASAPNPAMHPEHHTPPASDSTAEIPGCTAATPTHLQAKMAELALKQSKHGEEAAPDAAPLPNGPQPMQAPHLALPNSNSGTSLPHSASQLFPSFPSGQLDSPNPDVKTEMPVRCAQQVLLPADLVPLTRKRMLLIVDSNNAAAFQEVSRQALACEPLLLLSPAELRASSHELRERQHQEQLFTLFLTHPVLALVRLFAVQPTIQLLTHLKDVIDAHLESLRDVVWAATADDLIDAPPVTQQRGSTATAAAVWLEEQHVVGCAAPWSDALHDPFVLRIVLRFAVCRAVVSKLLSMEDRRGATVSGLPVAVPDLPAVLSVESVAIQEAMEAIVSAVVDYDSASLPTAD